jgi:hypothetical protein
VLVETRWREYDENRQVVGPVFHSSCTITSIKDPVIIQNPLQVHDTTWEDLGAGQLKIKTHGTFFSPGITMQSGKNTYAPATFDGQELQFFAPAKDLINNGEITLVGESNKTASITIPRGTDPAGCRIKSTSLWAIPQADGSARVRLMLEPDKDFTSELPRSRPLVLIGSDIYGLRDKPFENGRVCDKGADHICVYHFTAQSDSLRSAANYYIRDIAWSNYNIPGVIHFAPMLSEVATYSSVTYKISGTDLKTLSEENPLNLKVFTSDSPKGIALKSQDLTFISDSEVLVTMPHPPKGKTMTLAWTPARWPLSREAPIVWDLTLPGQADKTPITATPSFLHSGDSQTITYTGSDFSAVTSVKFENSVSLTFKLSLDDPKSMDVFVPTAVTKEPGHKELIATAKDKKGKTSQIVLPLDVFKQ